MSFEAAQQVIKNRTIGFSCLEDLNDPFECSAFGFEDNVGSNIPASVAANACKNRFSRKYAVLSMTRQPLNALMWSHYGDSHQGVVIGIDVDVAGLNNQRTNVIPSDFGEMIYCLTKRHRNLPVISEETLMSIGQDIEFDANMINLVKRAFLYKSLEWAYEEEVRIVKNISHIPFAYHGEGGTHEQWTKISVLGRPLYCFTIPENSIKEIYLGSQVYRNVTRKKSLTNVEFVALIESWLVPRRTVSICKASIGTWDLISDVWANKS
tara:strand:- start:1063 stop:1860 length:798 start_codon:yes stop_codon:yes gene_type:complete